MFQAYFNVTTISVRISIFCLLCVLSLSLYAADLTKQIKSKSITSQDATKALESRKNQLETINTGNEMDIGNLQKEVQERSKSIAAGTKIIKEINKESDCIRSMRTDCPPPSTQQKPVTPIAPVTNAPTLQPRGISPNQPQALPKIKLPPKLQQPSVQLNNKPVQIKPAKKGGFSPAPKKPDLGSSSMGGFTAPTVAVKNELPKIKDTVTPKLNTPQLTTKPAEAGKPKPNMTLSPSSSPSPAPARGGFVPAGVADQIHDAGNALSPQDLAKISGAKTKWEQYKHAIEEKRRREEAEMQARIAELTAESYSHTDCDDSRRDVYPGAPEKCDGVDNNCNGQIDEGLRIHYYHDFDGDSFGAVDSEILDLCPSEFNEYMDTADYVSTYHNDCDDTDPDVVHDCGRAE